MTKKNKTKKVSIRKWIIIGLILLIIIIPCVIIFPVTYNSNKVTPFSDSTYEEMDVEDFSDFKFSIRAKEYHQTEKKVFSASISDAKENYTYTSISYKVALGNKHWTGYYTEASSYTTIASTYKSTSTYKDKTNTITSFTSVYPVRKLLFIKYKEPQVFVLLRFKKASLGSTAPDDYTYVMFTYDLSDLIDSNTI